MNKNHQIILALLLLFFVAIGYGGYWFYEYAKNTHSEIDGLLVEIDGLRGDIAELKNFFVELADNNAFLQEALQNEQQKSKLFEETLKDISGDVDTFKKLSELDPELLKKYSKVYFLSENYTPSDLKEIPEQYLYREEKPEKIHAEVSPFLTRLIRDAKDDGIELYVLSAYRSFGEQANLKSQYVVRYGAGTANSFSAEQGYSEHQLGTTVDFMTTNINGNTDLFKNTEAYQWLLENAYKQGFVLSYPPNNSYYVFEPWHWRFVGQKLASHLRRENMYFYDMPQRDIDEFLINIFD